MMFGEEGALLIHRGIL